MNTKEFYEKLPILSEKFFEKLSNLSNGEKAALRRNAGKMLNDADGNAIIAFYKCLPYEVEFKESVWFAVACIYCMSKEHGTEGIEDCFAIMKNDSDSIKNRLAGLLDMKWDNDGFFLSKLSRMAKMTLQKGYLFDSGLLLKDLLTWENDNRFVQKKWAKALFNVKPEEQAEGENENVD